MPRAKYSFATDLESLPLNELKYLAARGIREMEKDRLKSAKYYERNTEKCRARQNESNARKREAARNPGGSVVDLLAQTPGAPGAAP